MKLLLAALALAALLGRSDAVATASIDFGSEWLKIGLVKPGVPMEIVLNTESQRKTAMGVSLSKGERLFGDHAVNMCVKDPVNSYRYLLPLLGQKADSVAVKEFQQLFPHYPITAHPTRGTVVFTGKDADYSVEELVAMVLEYAIDLAVKFAEQPITSVVVTVPPFFTQAQRKALLLAGRIANINIVQLINTNTAVAINYGVFRRNEFNETPQRILFFDMGAGSTTASVIEYTTVKKKGSKQGTAQLEILGVGFDATLGGMHFDMRLAQHLMKLFSEKYPNVKGSPAADGKASAKFFKEAQRVKKILSANAETYAQIENAFAEKDFKVMITRTNFETLVEDLYKRVTAPLDQALAASGVHPQDLAHFIIVGGCTRIPRIQAILSQHLGGRDLGKSINADEAAAMGAAYQAAVLSKGFRVKEFLVKDITPFPVEVEYEKVEGDGENETEGKGETRVVSRTLFNRNNPMPQKKLLSFNNKKADFSFTVKYGNLTFLPEAAQTYFQSSPLLDVQVSDVAAAFAAHPDATPKGIKAHFRLDESGILHFDATEALFEPPVPAAAAASDDTGDSILSTLSSFLSGESSTAEKAQAVDGEDGAEEAKTGEKGAKGSDDDEGTGSTGESDSSSNAEKKDDEDSESETKEKTASGENKQDADGESTSNGDSSSSSSSSTSEDADAKSTTVNNATDAGGADSSNTTSTSGANATNTSSKGNHTTAHATKPKIVKVPLTFKAEALDAVAADADEMTASLGKLRVFAEKEQEKREVEMAKNAVEAFVYITKDKLTLDDVISVSTEEERTALDAQLSETSMWLDEDGFNAAASVYRERLASLNKTARPIFFRLAEKTERPEALARLHKSLNMTQEFVAMARNLSANLTEDEEPWIRPADVESLLTLANETSTWLATQTEKQELLKDHEDPVLKSSVIKAKADKVDRELVFLIRRYNARPKAKKAKTNSTKTNKTATNTTAGNSTEAEGEETVADNEGKDGKDGKEDVDGKEAKEEQKTAEDEDKGEEKGEASGDKGGKKKEEKIEKKKGAKKEDKKEEKKKDAKKETKKEEKKEEKKKDAKKEDKKETKKEDKKAGKSAKSSAEETAKTSSKSSSKNSKKDSEADKDEL